MNYKQLLYKITTFIFDVDGVLTNGNIVLMPDGSMSRVMNVRDGFAMQFALKKGYHIAIITSGRDKMVKHRLTYLGITDIYLGSINKIEDYKDLTSKYNLLPENTLYMGDDIPDIEVMKEVGLATCPHDACPEIRNISKYISPFKGGKGCVRDIIEQTLKVQGNWNFEDNINVASI